MKIQKIKAKSCSYGGKRSLSGVKYIVIHNTGNTGDTAVGNGNYFKYTNTRSAGAHYFVDRKGIIVESIPMTLVAWSVGGFFTQKNGAGSYYKKCTNSNSVSIELCDIVKKYPSSTQVDAVKQLVAYIQKKCPNAKIIIRHWDVNGKNCPAIMSGKDNNLWKKFKKAILNTKSEKKSQNKASKSEKISFRVKITSDTLNVRSGAGTKYKVVDKVRKGEVYTIIATSNGWGKLKSGAGWIKLSYTQKL